MNDPFQAIASVHALTEQELKQLDARCRTDLQKILPVHEVHVRLQISIYLLDP